MYNTSTCFKTGTPPVRLNSDAARADFCLRRRRGCLYRYPPGRPHPAPPGAGRSRAALAGRSMSNALRNALTNQKGLHQQDQTVLQEFMNTAQAICRR